MTIINSGKFLWKSCFIQQVVDNDLNRRLEYIVGTNISYITDVIMSHIKRKGLGKSKPVRQIQCWWSCWIVVFVIKDLLPLLTVKPANMFLISYTVRLLCLHNLFTRPFIASTLIRGLFGKFWELFYRTRCSRVSVNINKYAFILIYTVQYLKISSSHTQKLKHNKNSK